MASRKPKPGDKVFILMYHQNEMIVETFTDEGEALDNYAGRATDGSGSVKLYEGREIECEVTARRKPAKGE